MLSYKRGRVEQIIKQRKGYTEVKVNTGLGITKAINYDDLTGSVRIGDNVVLNTTAVDLQLGTGGYDYIITNLSHRSKPLTGKGHIMKLRYTPMQIKVLSIEEEANPLRRCFNEISNLNNTPVLVGSLHSMLAPAAFAAHYNAAKKINVVYIMTDAAALPLALSETVDDLRNKGLIQGTVTIGNAFGGDLEAVNIYSGLLAAKAVLHADIIIAVMGPGIVGTGSIWGYSGIEQGQIINAVHTLQGKPIAIPRISFADRRSRHFGLSHHTLTVLKHVTLAPAIVPMACLPQEQMDEIKRQWEENDLNKHQMLILDVGEEYKELLRSGLNTSTMGRGLKDDVAYFLTVLAAGKKAAQLVTNGDETELIPEHSLL